MDEREVKAIIEHSGATMRLREYVSAKGDGKTTQRVYACRGRRLQRSLGSLAEVQLMNEEELRQLIATKLGAGFKEEQ